MVKKKKEEKAQKTTKKRKKSKFVGEKAAVQGNTFEKKRAKRKTEREKARKLEKK